MPDAQRVSSRLLPDMGVGAAAGVLSGTLGVGGGLVLVPYLVLVRGVPQKVAQATALVLVCMAALAGVVPYALSGEVAPIPAACILAGGIVGALVGAAVVQRAPSRSLQFAFGILLILISLRLVWSIWASSGEGAGPPPMSGWMALAYAGAGLAMGLLSALFGIGGGIILVPILVALFGYSQQLAAGTSLAVMILIALVGALRLTRPGLTDWRAGARFGLAAMVGAVVGANLAIFLPEQVLRVLFAVFLAYVGVRMILRARASAA